jgi:hypothetical protein
MKKATVFLLVSASMIVLSGCAGSNLGFFQSAGGGYALVNPPFPSAIKNVSARGICLPISSRSSLNIDVECIFDYVQGDSTLEAQYLRDDFTNPWIRWNIDF